MIMSKSASNIVNTDHIENIHVGADGKSIKANMASRSGCELAKYETRRECNFALGMLFASMKADDSTFQFPETIPDTQIRGSGDFKSKRNRHGGS